MIDDTQGHGEGTGTMPFHLWPAQVRVLWDLMVTAMVIMLKARQLGMSWICCAFALWLCMFHPGKNVLFFSKGRAESDELLRRVKVLYQRLPEWLRLECPLAGEPNKSLIEWANGSRIRSYPATRNAGTGEAASLVVIDEAAKILWADDLWTNLKPTIDGGGKVIVLSTAFGVGNLFHRLWTKASAGANGFRTIFLPWWSRPGRDAAWYARKVAEAVDPAKVKQEYPSTPNEAFQVSGRVRFAPEWIEAQAANVREPLAPEDLPGDLAHAEGLLVYEAPTHGTGRRVLISADVAEGLERGDLSDASIMDADSWQELAALNGHWEPDEFAERLAGLAEAYDATIVVERNNHGHAVLLRLNQLCPGRVARGVDGRPGWLTNAQTKPVAIDALAVALRDGLATYRTQAALDEMQVYRRKKDGGTGAPEGFHDDRVMSRAIGLGWLSLVGMGRATYGEAIDDDWRG